jgi:hypothetical protein
MKKARKRATRTTMREHYDFAKGVRAKYAARAAETPTLVAITRPKRRRKAS